MQVMSDTTPATDIIETDTGAATPPSSVTSTSSAFADFLLGRLRVAYLRTRIVGNEIATAGLALKSGLIDGETALAMLSEAGLLPLIEASS
jgi:hypothetical protein